MSRLYEGPNTIISVYLAYQGRDRAEPLKNCWLRLGARYQVHANRYEACDFAQSLSAP